MNFNLNLLLYSAAFDITQTTNKNKKLKYVLLKILIKNAPKINRNQMLETKKRYHNREAVVISALQVEKHPLTTPGPYSTPPPPRHPLAAKNSLSSMTPPPMGRFEIHSSRNSSPIPRPASCASGNYGSPRIGEGFRCSPKPHSSPKMKLRLTKQKTRKIRMLSNFHCAF